MPQHGEEFSNTLLIKVEGSPLPADVVPLLVGGYIDDSTNVPDLFVLRFNDVDGTVLTKASIKIGTKVELSVQTTKPGGPDPLLIGEVTALEVEVTQAGTHTIVRGLDKSHRLFRGTRVEAYVDMTASDIVRKVAQRAGLELGQIDATKVMIKHATQDGVNDWDFLRRLAAESDRMLTVTASKLDFVSRTPAADAPAGRSGSRENPLILERGVNLINLRGTITSNGQVPEAEVRGWDPATKKPVIAKAPAKTVSAQVDGVTPQSLAGLFKSPPYLAGISTLVNQDACTSAATSLADHVAGGFAELEGTARGNADLRAGKAVQLAGVTAPFAGKYVLSSTRHEFGPERGYLTSFVVSNTSERTLYGTTSGANRAPHAGIRGVVPALVTNTRDPENRGRVKIQLPWLSDTYESWWARPALPGAGPKRGMDVLPEVGDEVLVAFGQDDLRQPYILGGLYNGKDEPNKPWSEHIDANSGAVKRRAWTSRTGMQVEFLEAPGGEELIVSTNNGAQKIALQQTKKGIEIVSEGPLKVTAKQDVDVSTGPGKVSLKGNSISVEATAALELKGATVKVSAQGAAEVSASGVTTIKGSLVKIN
ncbi:VgrG-related protein [Nocardioides speluncae]|uniref:VgrG-related protein n=1 Tax=Nocardioides speluncae TaxID=2670337 RepID=UPI000D68C9EE|nr:VgrG-related protein [Nocardioides speluncae]